MSSARQVDRDEGMKYLDGAAEPGQELASIQLLMELKGDIAKGQDAFATYCLSCHQMDSKGNSFGPDLSEIANKLGKEALYTAIIYPDAAISHGFEGVHLALKDGSHYLGYVISDNAQKVELRVPSGSIEALQKSDIASQEMMENSLMTPGLAQAMGQDDLVNLVTYLSTLSNQKTMASNPFQGIIGYERDQ